MESKLPSVTAVFRSVVRPDYGSQVANQLLDASRKGPGDLSALLRSNGTWTVE